MRLFILAALTAMTPMAAAQAQQHQPEQKAPAQPATKKPAAKKAPARVDTRTGTRADRCKRSYKSYNAKTGRYRDAKGRSRACTL